jgi:hypothetical protein
MYLILLMRKEVITDIGLNRDDTDYVSIMMMVWTRTRANDQDELFLNWCEEPGHGTTGTMGQGQRKTRPPNEVSLRLGQKADQKTEEASRKTQVGRAEVR